MSISFSDFLLKVTTDSMLMTTIILTLAVIMVNGWTDAPNAIATCVSTLSMSVQAAVFMAAIFNFLGLFLMTMINSKVAQTIYNMVNFGGTNDALIALCASLFAIIIWATAAWWFGIPTSESHALIAGITGAAIALHNGFSGINGSEWVKVLYGLVFSTFLGFAMGGIIVRITELIFRPMSRSKANVFFKNAQIVGGAAMSFMHGAQDGQKFMGVFMLVIFLADGRADVSTFQIPVWMILLCSAIMGLGTSIGGYRIIKSVGMDMCKLEKYQGFSADMAAASCLFISSMTGIPVSTTHTKTAAIMGVGAAKRLSSVNWGIVSEMVMTWILTFPGCGLIGFLMVKLFMAIF
ncbi:MAG: inorganic phosphate transporter [Tissierellia bacterium]|nr:inorganic phosphate transporter [Tissierellia bacterium]